MEELKKTCFKQSSIRTKKLLRLLKDIEENHQEEMKKLKQLNMGLGIQLSVEMMKKEKIL